MEEYREWSKKTGITDSTLEQVLEFTGHLGEKMPYQSTQKLMKEFPVVQLEE